MALVRWTVRWARCPRGQGLLLLALALLGLGACARPGRPLGGPEDRVPPMIVSTWPDTFQVMGPTRDPVRITFNERISERPTQGRLTDAVLVSPATGGVEVKHGRLGLEVSLVGGFQPGLVYRVRILPVIKDLFGNSMEGPFELVFSTGGEFQDNVLAGVITDRLTEKPMQGARVDAAVVVERGAEPGPVYTTRTDSAGIFLLRYVPGGAYSLTAYTDNNRNGTADFRELQASTSVPLGLLPAQRDTVVTRLALLAPDTTPARLVRAEAVDSLTLRLQFDDFVHPDVPLDEARVSLQAEGEPEAFPAYVLWKRQIDSLKVVRDSIKAAAAAQARADSLQGVADSLQVVVEGLRAAGDTLRADSVGKALDAVLARLAPRQEAPEPVRRPAAPRPPPGQPAAPKPILPEQEFFVVLDVPLVADRPYRITVSGVSNVNSLAGGGGEATLTWKPPPPAPARRGGSGASVPAPGPMGARHPPPA